jgi:CheY-like chemotaxis protein
MAHVLVVDDSPTIRLSIRTWLEQAGHQVSEAADGLIAMQQLRELKGPLVVLLDYQMPGMDGFEVLQTAMAERRSPPDYGYVIISSLQAGFPPEFVNLLRQLSIQIMPKPFESASVLAVVEFVAARLESGVAVSAPARTESGA